MISERGGEERGNEGEQEADVVCVHGFANCAKPLAVEEQGICHALVA